jgi:small subunit ribosomal protein S6
MYIVETGNEELIESIVTKFDKLLVDNGATIEKTDRWGKRRLAYEINDQKDGYYVLITFEAEANVVKELDRVMRITDGILRHMIVKQEA